MPDCSCNVTKLRNSHRSGAGRRRAHHSLRYNCGSSSTLRCNKNCLPPWRAIHNLIAIGSVLVCSRSSSTCGYISQMHWGTLRCVTNRSWAAIRRRMRHCTLAAAPPKSYPSMQAPHLSAARRVSKFFDHHANVASSSGRMRPTTAPQRPCATALPARHGSRVQSSPGY
jgi:hypothetical protein